MGKNTLTAADDSHRITNVNRTLIACISPEILFSGKVHAILAALSGELTEAIIVPFQLLI